MIKLTYSFFFPSFLAGPTFDYATYDALVLHRLYTQAPVPTPSQVASGSKGAAELVAAEKETRRRVPYGRKRVAYLQLVLGLTFMGVYATYGSRGNYERILGNDWLRWGWVVRFGFVQLAGVVSRTKYYGVWCLCEVSPASCQLWTQDWTPSPVDGSGSTDTLTITVY